MSIDINYIKELIKLLEKSNLSEMVLQDGEQLIELRKPANGNTINTNKEIFVEPSNITSKIVEEDTKEVSIQEKTITSPMVGTYYGSTSPGMKPLVKVGDTISAGQVVCIIEAMKLMNEIEAEVSGKVKKICVEDGQPVEYGQILMYIE